MNIKWVFRDSLQICPKHVSSQKELSEIWLKMYVGLHVQYPLFLPDFKEIWIFSRDFRKNPQIT